MIGSPFLYISCLRTSSDGSGSKIFDPCWVRSIFCGSAIYGLGLNLEIFPQIFQFFSNGQKISLSRVEKYLGQRQVSLLFTVGKK